jgi:hypothetical protein
MNERMHHVKTSCFIHFSCMLQQHNTNFISLSAGLVYSMMAGKAVGGGQDAKLAGEEQQQPEVLVALPSDKGEWRDAR